MPKVFAAHPHLTDGATTIDPKGNVVTAGLYLDGNGPHPINSFGCTICHGGQGSGTDFTYASHTPNTSTQAKEWDEKYGWHEIHHWDEPMLPKRFVESSCLKCHHQVTDVPQAKKLQAGYQRIVKYGCTGCHTIGGEGSFGPDLTDEPPGRPEPLARRLEGLEGLDPQVDQGPARLPARHADAPVLRRDQQRRQGRLAQERRRGPRDHPLPVRQEHRARRLRRSARQDRPGEGARSCSSRRAAWPATRTGPTSRARSRWPTATSINPDYKPDAAATYDPQNVPGSPSTVRDHLRLERHGRLRPEPVEHRGQVPVASPGPQVAGQLDPRPGEVPPPEPDAQPPALVRRTPPTSRAGSSRSRASGR